MPVSRAMRRLVLERAAGACEYCHIRGWPLTVDHIVPRGHSGASDTGENLAAACGLRNRAKSNATTGYDARTGGEQPLFNPRQQQWEEQLRWSADFLRIIGVTARGRATVQRLRLNRQAYQQQRALLRAAMRGGGPAWP